MEFINVIAQGDDKQHNARMGELKWCAELCSIICYAVSVYVVRFGTRDFDLNVCTREIANSNTDTHTRTPSRRGWKNINPFEKSWTLGIKHAINESSFYNFYIQLNLLLFSIKNGRQQKITIKDTWAGVCVCLWASIENEESESEWKRASETGDGERVGWNELKGKTKNDLFMGAFFLSIAYICRFSSEQTFLRCVICCHSRAWNDENEKKKERKEHATKKKTNSISVYNLRPQI